MNGSFGIKNQVLYKCSMPMTFQAKSGHWFYKKATHDSETNIKCGETIKNKGEATERNEREKIQLL